MIFLRPLIGNLLSLIALILLLLCLFAGSTRQFVPNAMILKINTSQLSPSGAPDFFNVYLMSYCFGVEEECAVDDGSNTTIVQSSITACSDINPLRRFDPGKALLDAIGDSDSAADVEWPSYLSDDFIALSPTSQAMAILFILGTCAVALSFVLRLTTVRYIWGPPGPPRPLDDGMEPPPSYGSYPRPPSFSEIPPSKSQLIGSITSSILLVIASVIATMISTQFVSLISRSGSPTVSAASGTTFLGMAWTVAVIQTSLTGEALASLLRYRARHCRCDWEEVPAAPGIENKRLISGYD